MHVLRNTEHNNKELIKLSFGATTVVLVCIFVKCYKVKNIIIKIRKYSI